MQYLNTMKTIEKNKLISMFLSEDIEIRKVAMNYITSTFDTTFTVSYMPTVYFGRIIQIIHICPKSNTYHSTTIHSLLNLFITTPNMFRKQAFLELLDLVFEYNGKDR